MPSLFVNTFDLLLETILYKYADPVKLYSRVSRTWTGARESPYPYGWRVKDAPVKSIQDFQSTQSASVAAAQWISNPLDEQVDEAGPVKLILDVHQPGSFGAGP